LIQDANLGDRGPGAILVSALSSLTQSACLSDEMSCMSMHDQADIEWRELVWGTTSAVGDDFFGVVIST